jgi:hypothetical protein
VEIPSELTANAGLRGNEYAWDVDDFPAVLTKAKSLGYGCLGGQFQFRVPGVTCEMYWLNADPDERTSDESWPGFSARSCIQTLDRFKQLLSGTDFLAEASRWVDVPELSGAGADPLQYLCFVAYFIGERPVSNNSFKPKPLRGSA